MATPAKVSRLNLALILLILSALAGLTYLSLRPTPETPVFQNLPDNPETPRHPLTIAGHLLQVEIRRTPAETSLGLSGRPSLAADTGMLFIFDPPQQTGFWMKQMLFDLDIIWIKAGRVIQIDPEVKAPTRAIETPQTVMSQEPIDAVLEVNAGFAKEKGINIGDPVELPPLTPNTPQ